MNNDDLLLVRVILYIDISVFLSLLVVHSFRQKKKASYSTGFRQGFTESMKGTPINSIKGII